MKSRSIYIARVYITESSHLLKSILTYLKEDVCIRGVTVFRAISGFGETGNHTSSLMDLSLDLPLVVEFFDEQPKIEKALDHLSSVIKATHIVFWEAKTNG